MVKRLCPQRWLGQLPGDGEKPEVVGSAATAILKCQALGALYVVVASASSAVEPASESEYMSALDAQLRFANDLAAAAAAGRAALQAIDWSKTEGAAITAVINAGRRARAEGSPDDEVIAAAHEAASSVFGHSPEQQAAWSTSDAALFAQCWIVGTRTQRYGTEEERANLAAIVASGRPHHTCWGPTHTPPQEGDEQSAPRPTRSPVTKVHLRYDPWDRQA